MQLTPDGMECIQNLCCGVMKASLRVHSDDKAMEGYAQVSKGSRCQARLIEAGPCRRTVQPRAAPVQNAPRRTSPAGQARR